MSVSRFAVAVAIALGGVSLSAGPVAAQSPQAAAPALNLSKSERAALAPLVTAMNTNDWAAAAAALPAAQAAAQGADARYFVLQAQLNVAIATNNTAAQAAAIDALLASGRLPAASLPAFYRNQAAIAQQANDLKKAEAALTRWAQAVPNDPLPLVALARIKADQRKPGEAAQLLTRAVTIQSANGQPVPEPWLKSGANNALVARMAPETIGFSQGLVSLYPTPVNWRDALLNYQQVGGLDAPATLDVMRLMRTTKSLAGERDYFALANELHQKGYSGEAKAVLDEGVANRMVERDKAGFKDLIATAGAKSAKDKQGLAGREAAARAAADGNEALKLADAHLGYGNHAQAAEFYRLALQKGGVDAGLVNTRLGIALAQAGQKVEAEAAFRAVTGPRQALAGYWLIWLNQRA